MIRYNPTMSELKIVMFKTTSTNFFSALVRFYVINHAGAASGNTEVIKAVLKPRPYLWE